MRNKYPGICYRCNEHVSAGAGHFEKTPFSNGWRVQHDHCAIKFRGTDVGKEGESEKRAAVQLRKLRFDAKGTGKRAQRARQRLKQMEENRQE